MPDFSEFVSQFLESKELLDVLTYLDQTDTNMRGDLKIKLEADILGPIQALVQLDNEEKQSQRNFAMALATVLVKNYHHWLEENYHLHPRK